MKGFGIIGGELEVHRDSRVVFTTKGVPVQLLPAMESFTGASLNFAHPPMDYCYAWWGKDNRGFNPSPTEPDSHAQNNTAQIFFTACTQELETAITLKSAPAGANVFFGQVRFTRTVEPTHTWYGRTIPTLQKQGEWIPWFGSGLMEQALGLTRIMHLAIEGGALKLIAQQSVCGSMGGVAHEWGDYPASNIFTTVGDNEGGNFVYGATPGLAVWTSTASPYRKSSNRVIDTDGNPADFVTHQRGNSDPVTLVNPTSYLSTYSVDVRGQFGRIKTT